MARMPGAAWQGEHGSRLMLRYDIVCIHTIVGAAPAHAAHFSTHANGQIDQSRDTDVGRHRYGLTPGATIHDPGGQSEASRPQ
jgi:hypothetical protein